MYRNLTLGLPPRIGAGGGIIPSFKRRLARVRVTGFLLRSGHGRRPGVAYCTGRGRPAAAPTGTVQRTGSSRALKVLIQRVLRAEVRVGDEVVGRIARGLLVFVGVEQGDTPADADYYADKAAGLRIFRDDNHDMNCSVEDIGGEVLVVPQFTLAADTRRGRRPSFVRAAAPGEAQVLCERFAAGLRARDLPVATGRFQAMMQVELVNDGPVTILLEPRGTRGAA